MKGKPGSSRFFVVTAVLFEDNEEAEMCDKRIDELRAELGLSEKFEFHFNSCPVSLRVQLKRSCSWSRRTSATGTAPSILTGQGVVVYEYSKTYARKSCVKPIPRACIQLKNGRAS